MNSIALLMFAVLSLAPGGEPPPSPSSRPPLGETAGPLERAPVLDAPSGFGHRQVDSLYARDDGAASPEERHLAPGWKMRPRAGKLQWAIWPPLLALSGCLAGALGIQNRKLRRQLVQSGSNDASIEILAVKSLGLRHRLALVATCGERLLISASDREVSLLSHLTPSTGEGAQTMDSVTLADLQAESVRPPASIVEQMPELAASASARPAERSISPTKKSGRRKKVGASVELVAADEEDRAFTLDDLDSVVAEERELSPRSKSRRKDTEKEERPRRNANFSSDVAGLARWKAQKHDAQPGQGA